MSRAGVDYPDVVDLVTTKDSTWTLVLVEERALTDEDAIALQKKLNNYLSFGLDGGLVKKYPDASGKSVRIRVDLYATPSAFVVEFLCHFRAAAALSGVEVVCSLDGHELLC